VHWCVEEQVEGLLKRHCWRMNKCLRQEAVMDEEQNVHNCIYQEAEQHAEEEEGINHCLEHVIDMNRFARLIAVRWDIVYLVVVVVVDEKGEFGLCILMMVMDMKMYYQGLWLGSIDLLERQSLVAVHEVMEVEHVPGQVNSSYIALLGPFFELLATFEA